MFWLAGCGQTYKVDVSGLSTGALPDRKTYVLLPASSDTSADDLQFKEFASYVQNALAKKGMSLAASPRDADIAVFLGYGIGAPQEHAYSYNIPQWGQTGIASSQTTGTVNTNGNYGTYTANTTYTPTYGITGYSTHVGTFTTHTRFMFLDAFALNALRRTAKAEKLWSTTATSTGASGDLREVFPALVVAAEPSLGVNTGQQISVQVPEGSARLDEMRGKTKASGN